MTREALASCVSCGKGVCLDCLNKHQGKIYCGDCEPAADPDSHFIPPGPATMPAGMNQSQGQNQLQRKAHHQQSLQSLQRQLDGLKDGPTVMQRQSHVPMGVPMSQSNSVATVVSDKDRLIAALLAFFLGTFGVHKFYVGEKGWGILYFLFSWTTIPALAGFVEGVLYLARPEEDFVRRYGRPMLSPATQTTVLLSSAAETRPTTPKEYERFLLRFAQRHDGQISMVHLMAESNLRQDRVEDALARLSAKGLVQSELDSQGHVRYYVPEFRSID